MPLNLIQDARRASTLPALQTIETLRDIDPDFPLVACLIFLAVAGASEPPTMQELQQVTDAPQSTISRCVQMMSARSVHRAGKRQVKPGHDIVRSFEDPLDTRFKRVELTPKGKALLRRLQAIS